MSVTAAGAADQPLRCPLASALGPTRLVLPASEADRWPHEPVVVEEKLDGANVSLWCASGGVQVASRSGPG